MSLYYPITEEGVERLEKEFYENYQYNYWFYKLKSVESSLDNVESLEESIDDDHVEFRASKFKQSLEADVVQQFYHSSESLFSLMLAEREPEPSWLEMKTIRTKQICDFIREEIEEGELTKEELKRWFYFRASEENDDYEAIEDSLSFIDDYLKLAGELFLKNDVYKEFKHGLRLYTGYTKLTAVNDGEEETIVEGDSLLYLDEEKIQKEGSDEIRRLFFAARSYNYDFYLKLGYVNYHLIRNLILMRQVHTNDEFELEEPIYPWTFTEDLGDTFDKDKNFFTTRVPYPEGERYIEM